MHWIQYYIPADICLLLNIFSVKDKMVPTYIINVWSMVEF